MKSLADIRNDIIRDGDNQWATEQNWLPLYSAHASAKIIIIGQAPGRLAQESATAWHDPSGRNLRRWMGIDDDVFYDPKQISILPMDFYFPGSYSKPDQNPNSKDAKKSARGDRPPRPHFAPKWHGHILEHMPNIRLSLLIGQYSQKYYLGKEPSSLKSRAKTLTETVRRYEDYLPRYFPLVHPSPRNHFWHRKNPWFEIDVVPVLQTKISEILAE